MGPSEWCVISEVIVDYASILLKDETWNKSKYFNPHKVISTLIEYLDDSIKCENVKDIITKDIENNSSFVCGYIDDLLTLILDKLKLISRGSQAIPQMKQKIKHKELESILGKINQAAFLIPLSRYFLNRIRHTELL